MSIFKRLISRSPRFAGSSFNSYYGRILQSGAGYPTADEARRDYANHAQQSHPFGWPM